MRRFLAFLSLVSLLLVQACHEEPYLKVTPSSLSFTEAGGSQTIHVSSNYRWTASVNGSGFSISPAYGDGETQVTVTAAPTSSTDPVSGSINISSEGLSASVSLSQEAKLTIQVGQMTTIPAEGGTVAVDIHYNTDYTVEIEREAQSWITFAGTKSLSSGKLTFEVEANDSPETRTGKVTVKDKAGQLPPITLVFEQEEKKVIEVGDIMPVPAEGGSFEVDVKYNTDFVVEVESGAADWIQFVRTKALTSGKLEFMFEANNKPESRTGKVTVKDKAGKVNPITLTFVQEEEKVIEVGDTMPIPAEGGSFEVDVKYNTDFVVEVESAAADWIKFVRTKALTSGKLEFRFEANNKPESRTGKVTLKDKAGKVKPIMLTFVQDERKMLVPGDVTKIPDHGGTFEMDLEYNTDFTVEVESAARSWITFVRTKALNRCKLEFQFAANEGDERTGKVTVKDKNGKVDPVTITFIQAALSKETKARRIAEKLYEAWGAREWENDPWIPGENWPGFHFLYDTEKVELWFKDEGIKGPVPECIGDFGDMLTKFVVMAEPDLKGTLPDSFRKLTGLEDVFIQGTGMTSVPEVFGDMKKLKSICFNVNNSMTGPLPKDINSPVLEEMIFASNYFTGTIPDTWAPYAGIIEVSNNCLSGKISHLFSNREEIKAFVGNNNLWQKSGDGFDISDLDIPGYDYWFEDRLLENLDGTTFSIPEVVRNNKYTVYMFWATWCPFSKVLMPQLKQYYDHYKQDGLEVIATIQVDDFGEDLFYDYDKQKKECVANGYDQWYNYYFTKYETGSYFMSVPMAEVYDQQGNILFSSFHKYNDPVRNRFGRTASSELIPFLETLLGPAEIPDAYESKDYSMDGEVMTLQKATVGKGINIVFMGDGYTDRDMDKDGVYETLMKQAMEEYFAIEPYKSFRDRFNVYAVKVVSKNGRIGDGYTTALGTYFGTAQAVGGNDEKCFEYALKVPGISSKNDLLVTVLLNTYRHCGTADLSESMQSGVAYTSSYHNDPVTFGPTLRHEAGGHGFAFLADEYSNYDIAAPADHVSYYNNVYEKYGWFANVDFTNDPSKIRWSAFLSDSRYKNEVGIHEGAALYSLGAWRPSVNSMMNENLEYFNAPSRWAIYQQIMKRSGETPSFEQFLEYDEVNLKKASAAAVHPPMKAAVKRRFVPTAPPVIVP